MTRDGRVQNVHIDNMLVGDIFHINTGEIMPVDCILVEGKSLKFFKDEYKNNIKLNNK